MTAAQNTPGLRTRTTRLAPSPTGALHLGNARTFLINWAMARQRGWRIVLRIDDLDSPRVKAGADRGAIADLAWLGLDWDEGPVYQLADLSAYGAAIDKLEQRGLLYRCTCTRKDIAAAQSAPHDDEHELRYPGTCRPKDTSKETVQATRPAALRVIVPDEPISFDDEFCGSQSIDVHKQVGDFVVASKAAMAAYQLAVVVDDARQGVSDVVRGDDLLRSTGRQLLLYRLLELTPLPRYWHLPLVVGPDGRRLAKRHGDTRVGFYRDRGVSPQRVIGLIGHYCGLTPRPTPMDSAQFRDRLSLEDLPRQPVTLTQEDHAWLLQQK